MKMKKKLLKILPIFLIFSLFLPFFKAFSFEIRVGNYKDKKRFVVVLQNLPKAYYVKQEGKNIILYMNKESSPPSPQNAVRFVVNFDIKKINTFTLDNPPRIVIDVYKKGGSYSWINSLIEKKYLSLVEDTYTIKPSNLKKAAYVENKEEKFSKDSNINNEDKSYLEMLMNNDSKPIKMLPHPIGKRVIVIDPGHGGKDPGCIGIDGVEEKNVVLAIGKKLAYFLRHDPRYKVIMTRDKDVFVPLTERAKIAIENRADLFISLHCNMTPDHSPYAHGTNIYVLSQKGINEKYNQLVYNPAYGRLVFGRAVYEPDNVKRVLASLALDMTKHGGLQFAKDVAKELDFKLHREVTIRNIHSANFVVLKTPDIPSVLIETGFLSNPTDVKELTDPAYQWKFAKAIYDAINLFFNQKPKNIRPSILSAYLN